MFELKNTVIYLDGALISSLRRLPACIFRPHFSIELLLSVISLLLFSFKSTHPLILFWRFWRLSLTHWLKCAPHLRPLYHVLKRWVTIWLPFWWPFCSWWCCCYYWCSCFCCCRTLSISLYDHRSFRYSYVYLRAFECLQTSVLLSLLLLLMCWWAWS